MIDDVTELRIRQLKRSLDRMSDDLSLCLQKDVVPASLARFSSAHAVMESTSQRYVEPEKYYLYQVFDKNISIRRSGKDFYIFVFGFNLPSFYEDSDKIYNSSVSSFKVGLFSSLDDCVHSFNNLILSYLSDMVPTSVDLELF